jgi:hypothetical protein
MTYDEIKQRLAQVESTLQTISNTGKPVLGNSYTAKSLEKLSTLKESLQKQLAENDETMFISTKGGGTKAVQMDRKTAMDLKKDPNITGIDTAKGQSLKEVDRLTKNSGIEFDKKEVAIAAKSTGKALTIALKKAGDEIARMKAIRLDVNSFDVEVTYKGEKKGYDEFSFYITDNELHLVDFSFDKALVQVGVKPSGEPIVNVDVLANELLKHFKSLNSNVNEVNRSNYTTPKHFDICPGAEALRDEIIKGGKSPEELGEWTFLHDELFRLEKAVIKANKADERHIKVANQFKSQIINLSRDLGIQANKIGYLSGHVKKIEDIASKTDGKGDNVTLMSKDISEGPYQTTYVKVSKRDYRKAISIIDQNIDPTYVTTDIVDDDGAGNVIIYFNFREREEGDFDEDPGEFIYDLSMDLEEHGITVVDKSHDLYEALDINDPVLMRSRVDKMKREKELAKPKRKPLYGKQRLKVEDALWYISQDLKDLYADRGQLLIDMEQEAEAEGGPIADEYGDELNKIEDEIQKLIAKRNQLEMRLLESTVTNEGAITHDDGGDLDVGHQDDEPSMLKASAFETAEYAAKLVKKLAQYDQIDGEVDFPNWWQKKLILARDYMSAAFHYLDSEEKQPAIDQLALEGREHINESASRNLDEIFGALGYRQGFDEFIEDNPGCVEAIMEWIGSIPEFTKKLTSEYDPESLERLGFYYFDDDDFDDDDFNESKGHPSKEDRGGVKKIHKAHSLVVAKMKELAKQYKAGDKSVVPQLKDLNAKKKALEISLDNAVAGTNKHQTLAELSTDQRNDLIELQNILDDVAQKGEEAREIIRQSFPNMLSKADAYGAFNFGSSANRYDTTLESIIEEIEEYYDEEEDDMEEEYKGKHQGSNYKWPMSKATKDRKEADKKKTVKEEMDGGRLFDYFTKKGYKITERRPDGYPRKEGVEGYQVSRGSDRSPQSVIFQHNPSTDQFTISQMSGYRIDQKDAIKAGMRRQGQSYTVGQDYYMTDGNYTPVDISAEGLKDIVDHVMSGLDREAKAQGDFYKDRGNTSGTIDEKEDSSTYEQRMINQIKRAKKDGVSMFRLPTKTQEYYRKNKSKFEHDVNETSEDKWPKNLTSRYSDEYEFKLVKVEPTYKGKPGRAKYEVVDLESGEVKGTQVYSSPDRLKAAAADLIKPQGGTRSTNLGETKNEATRQDLGMVSSISKSRAKAHLKNPSNDGSKVYGLDKDGKRVHIKSINDVDKFKRFEIDADLKENVKVGDILTKDGKKGKVVKVMDDMANVDFGNGDVYGITFSRIKGSEILNEEATCCGKCGRVHVKGNCKRPYLKGKSHCRNK